MTGSFCPTCSYDRLEGACTCKPAVSKADELQAAREHGMLMYKAFVLQLCEEYCDKQHRIETLDKSVRYGELHNADTLYQHIKDSICKSF